MSKNYVGYFGDKFTDCCETAGATVVNEKTGEFLLSPDNTVADALLVFAEAMYREALGDELMNRTLGSFENPRDFAKEIAIMMTARADYKLFGELEFPMI